MPYVRLLGKMLSVALLLATSLLHGGQDSKQEQEQLKQYTLFEHQIDTRTDYIRMIHLGDELVRLPVPRFEWEKRALEEFYRHYYDLHVVADRQRAQTSAGHAQVGAAAIAGTTTIMSIAGGASKGIGWRGRGERNYALYTYLFWLVSATASGAMAGITYLRTERGSMQVARDHELKIINNMVNLKNGIPIAYCFARQYALSVFEDTLQSSSRLCCRRTSCRTWLTQLFKRYQPYDIVKQTLQTLYSLLRQHDPNKQVSIINDDFITAWDGKLSLASEFDKDNFETMAANVGGELSSSQKGKMKTVMDQVKKDLQSLAYTAICTVNLPIIKARRGTQGT